MALTQAVPNMPELEELSRRQASSDRSGRPYLATDPGDVRAGVQVLEQVQDKLDCIYSHLRENPALCMRQASPGQAVSAWQQVHWILFPASRREVFNQWKHTLSECCVLTAEAC